MHILIACDPGAAPACAQEAQPLTTEVGPDFVIAEGTREDVAAYCWRAQTALDVLLILERDARPEQLHRKNWPREAEEILKDKTFAVRATGFDDDQEQNEEWGGVLKEQLQLDVDLDKPGVTIIPFKADDETILGLSLTGRDVRKRDYRVFTSNTSLRSTTAAAALRLAGYTGEEKLLLPYENDGTLAIEAAFMATRRSPYHYSGLAIKDWWNTTPQQPVEATINVVVPSVQFLKAVQKNAKIAGVHKSIAVTKAELDWLDTKYDEHTFTHVVANLPCSGKRRKATDVKKVADELAYQAKYVLAKKGLLTIISLKPDEHTPSFKEYTEIARHELRMGGQPLWVVTWEVS